MTDLPTSIRVGPVMYRVTDDHAEFIERQHTDQRSGDYGCTRGKEAVIYLNPEVSADNKRLTLLHEAMHAAGHTYGGGWSWKALGKTPSDREERVISLLETPLLALLRDNPRLVAYLTATDEETA